MNLYLLRHGAAVQRGAPGYLNDADRPLTDEGREKLRAVARAMKAMKLNFDRILSSPCQRARQTAEIIADRLDLASRVEFSDHLAPDGRIDALIQQMQGLRPKPENVLLVGHEPYLSELASMLITGKTGLPLKLRKGGLVRLSANRLRVGACAELDWLLTPGLMKLMR
ncbi:MAG: phosphohistidine phosphatase SixA [Verrucomicrobia bacterium]|nr:phosphohistidine phosphatase SixA [Verrucomicrobiota bacterium]